MSEAAHEYSVPAVRGDAPVPISAVEVARNLDDLVRLGNTLVKTGFLPDAIKNGTQAAAIIIKGQELQIPPMQALSHINVIKGKPTMSAELMRALAQRAGHKIRVIESTARSATVEGIRADDPGHSTRITFDELDVRRAGLQNQSGHKNYPAALKLARATSALCRAAFADAIGGVSWTPEELGAEVDEDGRIVEHAPVRALPTEHAPEASVEVEGEVVDEGSSEPESNSEHEDLLRQVGEAYNALPEDVQPDKRKVWEYAKGSEDDARKTLDRLLRLREEAEPAPHPDEVAGVERGGAARARNDESSRRGSLASEPEPEEEPATPEQLELVRSTAAELVEDGVAKFEQMVGRPVDQLTKAEAEEWLHRLSGRQA